MYKYIYSTRSYLGIWDLTPRVRKFERPRVTIQTNENDLHDLDFDLVIPIYSYHRYM